MCYNTLNRVSCEEWWNTAPFLVSVGDLSKRYTYLDVINYVSNLNVKIFFFDILSTEKTAKK